MSHLSSLAFVCRQSFDCIFILHCLCVVLCVCVCVCNVFVWLNVALSYMYSARGWLRLLFCSRMSKMVFRSFLFCQFNGYEAIRNYVLQYPLQSQKHLSTYKDKWISLLFCVDVRTTANAGAFSVADAFSSSSCFCSPRKDNNNNRRYLCLCDGLSACSTLTNTVDTNRTRRQRCILCWRINGMDTHRRDQKTVIIQ